MTTHVMDPRRRLRALRAAVRERRWRRMVGGWTRSGLSQRVYARRSGVSLWSLRWWIYELRRRDSLRGQERRPVVVRRLDAGRATPAPRFLPVKVVRGATADRRPLLSSSGALPLEVLVGDRRRIRVNGDFDEVILVKLVNALEAAP